MLSQVMESLPTTTVTSNSLIDGLIDTLRSERRLLDELRAIMARQRDAVARDDLQAIDDTVFAVQRVLLTLNEARNRRRTLSERLGCDTEAAPHRLADALGHRATEGVRLASCDVEDSARRLSREVATTREVLRKGLATGEEYVRILVGAGDKGVGYPRRADGNLELPAARLVNRQA